MAARRIREARKEGLGRVQGQGHRNHDAAPEQRKELYDRTAPVREQFAKEIPAELLQLIADTQK